MIDELLKQMTIKEKIGQLAKISPFFLIEELEKEAAGPIKELNLDEAKIFSIGSILGVRNAEEMIKVQKRYLEKSRLKIPLLFMGDIIHGFKTIFPVPLALASSFDPETARTTAKISAREANVSGLHMTFSPMADLVRDPRWGRVVESFGESKYLVGEFSRAMVEGYQEIQEDKLRLGSCVKHFAGYGAVEGGKDYNTVDMSRLRLHNTYLSGYHEAIKAGCMAVMTAFTLFEGVPCTINEYLLRDVLRRNFGFAGVTISDYDSLAEAVKHGVAEDMRDAAKRGIIAGLDIEMASVAYLNHLEELVNCGEVPESLIDEAVVRILRLKQELGLFENPFVGADSAKETTVILHPDHLKSAKEVARDCLVLMQNDGVLPLNGNERLAVIGPFVLNKKTNGPWSWHGYNDENDSLTDMLIANNFTLTIAKSGHEAADYSEEDYECIVNADVVILYLGEVAQLSGEAHSLTDISLPQGQRELYQKVKALGKKTVVLLQNGRPLVLDGILDSNAIMETWFLGSKAAEAICDTLVGENNPSGKLPMSFPRCVGQIPVYHDQLPTGRPMKDELNPGEYESKYLDQLSSPQFTFGHGLSYSKFILSELVVDKPELDSQSKLNVQVTLHNVGPFTGKETIQVYLADPVARISRPVKELIKTIKVELEVHETKTVAFQLDIDDLTYYLADGKKTSDKGLFKLMVGIDPDSLLEVKFTLI